MQSARTVRPSYTNATAVSSQEDSTANMIIGLLLVRFVLVLFVVCYLLVLYLK